MTNWPELCLRLLRACYLTGDPTKAKDDAAAALLREGEPWMAAEVLRLRFGEPVDREGELPTLSEAVDRAVWQERFAEQEQRRRMTTRMKERE